MLRLILLAALAGCGVAGVAGPVFPAGQLTAVRAAPGHDATLECRVLHLAPRTVSWVRARDLRILSHAGAVFTGDTRVSAASRPAQPPDTPAMHTLRIARLRPADAGRYECQLNTEPKMSLFFDLAVTDEPEAAVRVHAWAEGGGDGGDAGDGEEVRVSRAAGGAVTLVCEARDEAGSGAAPHVRWTHAGHTVGPQSEGEAGEADGGVWVETRVWAGEGRAVSRVTLAPVRAGQAGRYRCGARAQPGTREASAALTLHVLQPAEMEAMQRDQWPAAASGSSSGTGAVHVAAWAALLVAGGWL